MVDIEIGYCLIIYTSGGCCINKIYNYRVDISVGVCVNGKIVVLIEHQLTINDNLPVRFLMYVTRIYERLLSGDDIYRKTLIPIPPPEFIVLYNGTKEFNEEKVLKLSDAFIQPDINLFYIM